MDTLHAQKENVDANFGGSTSDGKLRFSNTDKFSTPKRGFVIHEDSKSAGSKGLKNSSSKKSRRVLGDISNKQRNRHDNSNSSTIVSVKKAGLGRGLGHSKKLSAKKLTPITVRSKSGTPLTPKERTSLTPKPHTKVSPESVIKAPNVEKVPDIEHAYGGLLSPKPKATYAEEVSREIEDLLNDKTPTLFDNFEPTRDDWDDSLEKAMLESGEPPSSWWASLELQTKKEADAGTNAEEENTVEDDLSELPPPDNLPDSFPADFDDGGLLEDILTVDFEAACGE
ncbi:hypothetical protein V7S43_006414 [Phytophthora oleae]|uniref:AGC-kinase C-terminal domain-containing protein n=1 Tax=Phytophthora oleae TaxID=2107226 RepID=A0ABD3FPI8_9STRA